MAQKPSIPKGTRDFNPDVVAKRDYIFNTVKSQFEIFGFQPIETPSFENSSTLMGKYGDEGDRLIFKILNSGDYFEKLKVNFESVSLIRDFFKVLVESLSNKITKDFCYSDISVEKLKSREIIDFLLNQNSQYQDFYEKEYFSLIEAKISDWEEVEIFLKSIFPKTKNFMIEHCFYLSQFNSNTVNTFLDSILEGEFLKFLKSSDITNLISEKALRYDLTVPFARYVVQHQNEIDFPFKRYQIQPVWRADRPQKGRFREFYQCDADVVGSNSLWQEVEFVQLYDAVFTALDLKGVTIKINNRKILSGIAEVIGAQDKLIDFTVALDKLDKIGEEKVKTEMLHKGILQSGIDKLQPLFSLQGEFGSQIAELKTMLSASEEGKKGIEELEFINKGIETLGLKTASLKLDVTLARGLNYYTGAIFEVAAPEGVRMGSIGGGGRYDDLTGIFGLKDMSGVGISFGLDRIYLVLEALGLFPETISNTVKVMFVNFGDNEALVSMKAINMLRENGISAELFPDNKKTIKQFNYANKREIPYVVLVGESEMQSETYTLKNMKTGEQEQLQLDQLISKLS